MYEWAPSGSGSKVVVYGDGNNRTGWTITGTSANNQYVWVRTDFLRRMLRFGFTRSTLTNTAPAGWALVYRPTV